MEEQSFLGGVSNLERKVLNLAVSYGNQASNLGREEREVMEISWSKYA